MKCRYLIALSLMLSWLSIIQVGAIELAKDDKTVIPPQKNYDFDNNFHVNLFYQAEKLSATSLLLSAPATIVSDLVAGLELSYAGPWRNLLQDFINYKVLRREYVQPSSLNLNGSSKITHEFSFGGHFRPFHSLQLSLFASAAQAPRIFINQVKEASIEYPFIYGLTVAGRYRVYQKDKDSIFASLNASGWSSKKEDKFELKVGYGGEGELLYERRLTDNSTAGFGIRHGVTLQDSDQIELEHTESSIKMFFTKSF